jgi:hypothetical protein
MRPEHPGVLHALLQQGLVTGAIELAQIRNQIMAQRNALKHQVDEAFRAMVQAEINAKAASAG